MNFIVATKNKVFGELIQERLLDKNFFSHADSCIVIEDVRNLVGYEYKSNEQYFLIFNDSNNRLDFINFIKGRPAGLEYIMIYSGSSAIFTACRYLGDTLPNDARIDIFLPMSAGLEKFINAIERLIIHGLSTYERLAIKNYYMLDERENEVLNFILENGKPHEMEANLGMSKWLYHQTRGKIKKKLGIKDFKNL